MLMRSSLCDGWCGLVVHVVQAVRAAQGVRRARALPRLGLIARVAAAIFLLERAEVRSGPVPPRCAARNAAATVAVMPVVTLVVRRIRGPPQVKTYDGGKVILGVDCSSSRNLLR